MSDREKMVEYELHIEGMLKAIQERLDEFDSPNNLSEFEQGRQIAYIEMMDIIKTRHKMVLEVLNE